MEDDLDGDVRRPENEPNPYFRTQNVIVITKIVAVTVISQTVAKCHSLCHCIGRQTVAKVANWCRSSTLVLYSLNVTLFVQKMAV